MLFQRTSALSFISKYPLRYVLGTKSDQVGIKPELYNQADMSIHEDVQAPSRLLHTQLQTAPSGDRALESQDD